MLSAEATDYNSNSLTRDRYDASEDWNLMYAKDSARSVLGLTRLKLKLDESLGSLMDKAASISDLGDMGSPLPDIHPDDSESMNKTATHRSTD